MEPGGRRAAAAAGGVPPAPRGPPPPAAQPAPALPPQTLALADALCDAAGLPPPPPAGAPAPPVQVDRLHASLTLEDVAIACLHCCLAPTPSSADVAACAAAWPFNSSAVFLAQGGAPVADAALEASARAVRVPGGGWAPAVAGAATPEAAAAAARAARANADALERADADAAALRAQALLRRLGR